MKMVALGDLAVLSSGGTPDRSVSEYFGQGTPWVSISDLDDGIVRSTRESLTPNGIAHSAAKMVPSGTLFVAMYGASIGKLGIAGTEVCTNQAIASIGPSDDVLDQRYLYHYLLSQRAELRARGRGGAQPNISLGHLQAWPVPLPPLGEQRRIAAILDHADALRRKRHQTRSRMNMLATSIFLEMFGDPDDAVLSGSTVRLGEIANLQGGRSLVADDDASPSKFRVLKISAVTSGRFKSAETKPLPSEYEPPAEHMVSVGDLLISRANTAELVGAVAHVDAVPPNVVLPDKLWRFVWNDPDSVPVFYCSLLQSASVRRRMSRLSSGTGGSMKNISKAKLTQLELPSVPIAQQRTFARRVAAIPQPPFYEFDNLFASLQSRAFRGEL